jgi:GNAT superfamily N-acetyltransferase
VTRVQVREFAPADLDPAARLLAARFARVRARSAHVNAAASDTAECRAALEGLLAAKLASAAVATWAGEPIGFAIASRSVAAPDSAQSYFNPAGSVGIPLYGHAVSGDEDPLAVYRALYAFLAARWVADGFLAHGIGVLVEERDAHDAWVTLGFGRHFTAALRGVEPLAEPTRADLEIREAGEKELPEVFALLAEQRAFHASSPMFLPDLRILHDAQGAMARGLITQPRCPTFVAYLDGRALGMQHFAPAGFLSWPIRDDTTVYLFQGIVRASERGGGVGAALLQHAFAWMRREGVTRCGLHYLAANPSGPPFWTHHGFRAAEHFLHRTVDARIAWSLR